MLLKILIFKNIFQNINKEASNNKEIFPRNFAMLTELLSYERAGGSGLVAAKLGENQICSICLQLFVPS